MLFHSDRSPTGPFTIVGQFLAVVVIDFLDGTHLYIVGVAAVQSAECRGLRRVSIYSRIDLFSLLCALLEALILRISDFISGYVILLVPTNLDLTLACSPWLARHRRLVRVNLDDR